MAQHTPGPWYFGDDELTSGVPVIPIRGADHRTVAEVVSTFVDKGDVDFAITDQDRANASLIAAAPELLKQLKGLLGFASFVINELDIDTESTEVILKANGEDVAKVPLSVVLNNSKVAIATAEGRS